MKRTGLVTCCRPRSPNRKWFAPVRQISLARAAVVPPCRGKLVAMRAAGGHVAPLSTGLGGAVVVYRGKRAWLLNNPSAGPLSINAASQGLRADQVHSVVFHSANAQGYAGLGAMCFCLPVDASSSGQCRPSCSIVGCTCAGRAMAAVVGRAMAGSGCRCPVYQVPVGLACRW